jgi:hypothetical protein
MLFHVPATPPRDSSIAIVGDGLGSLIVYSTAVYLGFRPEQLTVYGTNDSAVATYQQFAFNLGQTVLRSESESHFLPADWPTFAQLDAWSRRSLRPLLRSIGRKYNPGVPDILAEATVVQQRLGWNDNRIPIRVGWLQREWGPPPHFVLYDEEANYLGRAKHVMLALGHGPLTFPPALARAREDPTLADRIVQAYEPKSYAQGGTYVVVGAGIASVNEWVNAFDAGASVVSLLRNPSPDEQDLNTPRCLFEALGTAPRRRNWRTKVEQARAAGRFDEVIGEIDEVQQGPAGLRVHLSARHGPDPGWLDITGIVAGTGFNKSALTIPLLRRLVDHYKLEVEDGKIQLRTNCGLPGLDVEESRICLMGLLANTVIPHGDTIAGLKYIGRRFVADCFRVERIRPRGFLSRLGVQLSLGSESAKAIRQVRRVPQLT